MTAQSETILEVVAAKICRSDTFLLCQRAATKSRPLMWEFVGGKVEPGETKQEALARKHGSRPSAANAGKNWAFRSSFMNR